MLATNKDVDDALPVVQDVKDSFAPDVEVIDGVMDKFFQQFPGSATTCDGKVIQPVRSLNTMEECATLCENTLAPTRCIGFQYYAGSSRSACMMFNDIDAFTSYKEDGCAAGAATC